MINATESGVYERQEWLYTDTVRGFTLGDVIRKARRERRWNQERLGDETMYFPLDGQVRADKRTRTPLDNVDVPRPPKRRPVYVEPQTIIRVEKNLRAGDPQTRARFMVLASTGIRPSQLARLTRGNVNLASGVVLIEGGKGGEPIAQVLTGDMTAAWRAFIAAEAWGPFDSSKFARLVRAAGWPSGVRVYNAKHSVGIALAEAGAEQEDIRAWFGHTDAATTRIYTGVPLSRMRRLSEKLEGRFGWDVNSRSTVPRKDGRTGPKVAKRGRNVKARRSA